MSSEYSNQVYFKDEIEAGKLDEAVDAVLQDEFEEVVEGPRDKQVLIRVSEMQRDKWQEAAEHDRYSDAIGTRGGIDVDTTLKYHRKLVKKGENGAASMLMAGMCGALWGEDRRHRAGYRTDPICRLCGQEADTEMHRYWECSRHVQGR